MNPASRWPFWLRLIVTFQSGSVAAFGLEPTGWWPATLMFLFALPVLFLSCETKMRAVLLGWLFATGYFVRALNWIVEPFLVDAERYAWMAPFALVFMAGGMALFWAPAFWFARRPDAPPVVQGVLLALFLSLGEVARGYLFTGFPWAGVAQIWVNTPVAQMLSLIGPYGLGALTFAVTLPLGAALSTRRVNRTLLWPVVAAVGFAVVALGYGLTRPEAELSGDVVRLVQPNAPQSQKWDPQYAPLFFNRQIDFTAAGPRPDLIVWPETAIPVWLENAGPVLDAIAQAAQGVPVILGAQRSEGARIYNSMVYLDETGQQAGLYDKHHLVPFGEYVPLGNLMSRIGIHGFATTAGQGFSAGPGASVLNLGGLGLALPLICYEAVFTQDVLSAPERPAFLLQITNDAWFGTRSGPYQHLAQAQMRAIEHGVPMLRSANTGVSAVIDPLGRITGSLALGEAGYIDAEIPRPLPPTFYSRLGDGPVFFALLGLVALLLRSVRRGKR